MKRNISNKLLIAVCLLVMVSCKARKAVVVQQPITPPPPTNPSKPVNPIDAIKAQQLNYNTFTAKSSTTLDIDGNSNDVTLNIRISHDKKIWVSVSKNILVDIELARALITPDSVYVINKLQHVYIKKPFSFIYTYASKQINYKTLEALLIGNAMPAILNDSRAVIAPADNGNTSLSGNLQELVYKLLVNPGKRVVQFNLSNPAEAQALQVINYTFIQAGNKVVPSQIDIQSAIKEKKIKVNLNYSKVDFDQQLDYPFNIPESYSPAD